MATASATTLAATAFLGVALATPALAEGGCGAPQGQASPGTVAVATVYDRVLELRANPGATCVWGRISQGSQGDSAWINRSDRGDMSNYPYSGAGKAIIAPGYNQAFTPEAYNDDGLQSWVCGKASNRALVHCTGRY